MFINSETRINLETSILTLKHNDQVCFWNNTVEYYVSKIKIKFPSDGF